MGTELIIKLPEPHKMQLRFRNSRAKRKIMLAGRRAGKTTACAIVAVEAMLEGHRVLEAAPVSSQTDAFWTECKSALAEPIHAGIIRKNETDRTLELANGGRIRCRTAHNADTLRGDYADLLILDEFSLMDESAWSQVGLPMLLDNDGNAIFCFTPKGLNHSHTLYQQAISDTTGRWEAFHFTSLDNPHLSKEALAEITQDMTEDNYKQEVLAQFLQNQGSVFRNIDSCLTAPPTTPAEHRGHLVVAAVDWGRVDDFTCVSVFCCNCAREVAIDRFNQIDWSFQRQRLLSLFGRWGVKYARVEANSTGAPNLEALQDAAPKEISIVGFDMTVKSKPPLIQRLALCFETMSAAWLADPVGRHELLAFESKVTETGYVKYGAPAGQHDDTVIARALCWKVAEANMPVGFTQTEKDEHFLPANLRRESLDKNPSDIGEFMRAVKLSEAKKEERQNNHNWSHDIVDPNSDPWEGAFKDPVGW